MSRTLKEFLLLNVGLLLVTINIHFFLVPNNFIIGGISGLSIMIHQYFPNMPVGLILLILEICLFILGLILLGFKFGIKSFYCSVMLSLYIWSFEEFLPLAAPLSDDRIIQLIVGLFIDAIGLVLIFKQNASSGGTDIVAMILNKFFSINVGTGIIIADLVIASGSFFVFGIENGMYAILGNFMLGFFINFLLTQTNLSKQVMIISTQSELIKRYIVKDLSKGATIQQATGAFTNEDRDIITTYVGRKEFLKLKKYISTIDQKAFVTVHNTSEIIGNGFRKLM
ncbi:YitT family protein [Metabacillus sp. HB246100]|uniref:YitT family protein n=1 Tax=Bacillus weihaiensis TaxID=1547283 RepID=UPI0023520D99|nr:YitT family protein [Bacillus weihaiensis]